jgi:hypothetical protein
MKTCLINIAIGEKYIQMYDQWVRARMQRYCDKHGYDLKLITTPIRDLPGKQFTWQKLCVFDLPWLREYDQVIFVDSDILVAKGAPAMPVVKPGKIGCVHDKLPYQINSGLLIFSPTDAIRDVFEEALLDGDPFWDQKALTRSVLYRKMEEPVDPRFNRQFYYRSWSVFESLFCRQWFYHACHGKSKIPLISAWLKLQFR